MEIELHYIPEGENGSPVVDGRGVVEGIGYPPVSPCSTSLASSFAKAALSFPEKATKTTPNGTIQNDLLALSPRMAKGAEDARLAAANGGRKGARDGCLEGKNGGSNTNQEKKALKAGSGRGGGGSWKAFFGGVLCSAMLVLGALWALGDPFLAGGLGMSVFDDGGAGRQTFIVVNGSVSVGAQNCRDFFYVGTWVAGGHDGRAWSVPISNACVTYPTTAADRGFLRVF